MAEGWSIRLDWRDILNIVLAAITVFQFFRNRRTKRVSLETLQVYAIQTAAHGFAEMSKLASDLETGVGKGEWARSLELAKRLTFSLAEASGLWSAILETSDVDSFDAARSEIRSVESSVSLAEQDVPNAAKREEIRQQCMNAAIYMAAIAGRLKRPSELKQAPISMVQRIVRYFQRPAGLSRADISDLKEAVKEVKKS
jgi:hypothetical protein